MRLATMREKTKQAVRGSVEREYIVAPCAGVGLQGIRCATIRYAEQSRLQGRSITKAQIYSLARERMDDVRCIAH